MAIDYGSRLDKLKSRRRGQATTLAMENYAYDSALQESLKELEQLKFKNESWESRSNSSIIKYVLGAMQEVDSKYTAISMKTAERVQNQLNEKLKAKGLDTQYRLQGSVPLNIHIKGVSDVDLLVIDQCLFTYDARGRKASSYIPSNKTSIEVLSNLRKESIKVLKESFPAVNVDTSGAKSIKLTGGSLARDVDVVPSTWSNTYTYQETNKEEDRGINIYDSVNNQTNFNLPFKHISLIESKCLRTNGSLRKSIRLCKNIKADLIDEGTEIYLSSYDIAALMYHINDADLHRASENDLSVLYMTQKYLDLLYRKEEETRSLDTPDATRKIIDSDKKFTSLYQMSYALDELLNSVCKQLDVSKENIRFLNI